jgi:hypothetical protein
VYFKTKKGEDFWFFVWHFYGRFFINIANTMPTMAIAIIIATAAAPMYISVGARACSSLEGQLDRFSCRSEFSSIEDLYQPKQHRSFQKPLTCSLQKVMLFTLVTVSVCSEY